VPQLEQGSLQPGALLAMGKPQRLQVSGMGGTVERLNAGIVGEGSRSLVPAFPRSALPTIRPGEKRICQPLDADGGIQPMPAVHHR
jgi:hypothetical protein